MPGCGGSRTSRKQFSAPTELTRHTVEGLAGWWTDDTAGNGAAGGRPRFRFPPVGGFDMEVLEAGPAKRVVDGPEEWLGTTIGWTLPPRDVRVGDWH